MSDEWSVFDQALQQMIEARFREYAVEIERDLFEGDGADADEPYSVLGLKLIDQRFRETFEPAGEIPTVLAGDVLEQDGEGWRGVNVAGFPVTDRRRAGWRPPVNWRKNLDDGS